MDLLKELYRDTEKLEKLVDAYTLEGVLNMLVGVCHDKAQHLNTNWQDVRSAKAWTNAARNIEKVASGKAVGIVS